MDLQKLFDVLQQKGYQTIGQVKSALATGGVHPCQLFVNHAELDKTLQALKPVAAGAAGAAAGAAAGSASPMAAPIAEAFVSQIVSAVLDALIPKLEHSVEDLEKRLHGKIAECLSQLQLPALAAPAATSENA